MVNDSLSVGLKPQSHLLKNYSERYKLKEVIIIHVIKWQKFCRFDKNEISQVVHGQLEKCVCMSMHLFICASPQKVSQLLNGAIIIAKKTSERPSQKYDLFVL